MAETIEVAHFWDGIEPTYRALKVSLAPLADQVLGHFSHAYPQGTSLYMILLGLEPGTPPGQRRAWRASGRSQLEIALREGAVMSHHHGVGLARLPYIRRGVGQGMVVLERIKTALDPAGIMEPWEAELDKPSRAKTFLNGACVRHSRREISWTHAPARRSAWAVSSTSAAGNQSSWPFRTASSTARVRVY